MLLNPSHIGAKSFIYKLFVKMQMHCINIALNTCTLLVMIFSEKKITILPGPLLSENTSAIK